MPVCAHRDRLLEHAREQGAPVVISRTAQQPVVSSRALNQSGNAEPVYPQHLECTQSAIRPTR